MSNRPNLKLLLIVAKAKKGEDSPFFAGMDVSENVPTSDTTILLTKLRHLAQKYYRINIP